MARCRWAFAWMMATTIVMNGSMTASADEPLVVMKNGALNQLALNGQEPFYVTQNGVSNARVVQIGDARVTVALWNEMLPTGVVALFYAVADDGVTFATARQSRNDIHLRYSVFDPAVGEPSAIPALAAADDTRVYIVQFLTQTLPAYRNAIESLGGTVYNFVPHQSHIVVMDADVRDRVAALPFVRWVGAFHPAYRLEEFMRDNLDRADELFPSQRYNIQVWQRGRQHKRIVADRIRAMGAAINRMIPDGFLLEATLTPEQLLEVVRYDEVAFIDRWSPWEEDLNVVRQMGGADYVELEGNYTGEGVRGEVLDTNLLTTHADFQARPPLLHGPRSGSSSHGTQSYGCVFGDGTNNPPARGLAPDGQGIFADFDFLSNRYTHTAELLLPPYEAVFQTASVGNMRTTFYTSISAETDDILFINDILVLQSQSNAGALGVPRDSRPQAWAKNIVSVGGVRHFNTLDRADDSWCGGNGGCGTFGCGSIGPASDGRIKPDLAHFYDCVIATANNGGYANFSGTSSATPVTAGHFALFFQMWAEGIFGNPVDPQATVFENRPHMTTAKAMMVQTAAQYPFVGLTHDKTRVHVGWGTADVGALYDMRDNFYIVDETDVLEMFDVATHQLTIGPDEPALRVTLVYADPAGTPFAAIHRVNDLSLRVMSPSGTEYFGNVGLLAGNWSTPGGVANTIDTVENVYVENPESGVWTVEIHADEINQDSHVETPELDADYALVASPVQAAADNAVAADAFDIVRGALQEGGLDELADSDDQRLVVNAGFTAQPGEPPVWIELDAVSPDQSPAEFSFLLEASTTAGQIIQRIELFNYQTQSFEEVDLRNSTPTDSIVEAIPGGNPNRFIEQGAGNMQARLTWKADGIVLAFPWTVRVDQAVWIVVPD